MTQQCYASGINPSAIPGDELDPDAVEAAARALAADGAAVRDSGADVLHDWRGLALHYEAPEAPRLFSVMDPVETNARRFGDDVESVAAALTAYAEEIRPIKASLAAVRADAWAFRSDIASEPEWEYDQDLVDRNTELVARVNALQVRLWEAERRCANAIRALYGAPAWRAATSEGDARGYGVDEIPTDAAMPWGSEVQRKDHCPKSAAVGVKRFVWDGVAVDGLWGTVTGLGMLVGIDGSGWSWETMKTSWVGMGSLIGYSGGEWSWGNAGDAWTALGKGLIAYDTWDEDPARAAGGAVFNIATIFIPAGAAVTGTKTAGTAAGTAGRTATLFARGARVVDFVDPVALGLMGGRAAVPRIGDLLADMRVATQGLGDSLRVPDAPTVPAVRADLDVPVAGADDAVTALGDLDGLGGDLPPVRDPDVAEPAAVPAPQPEPALVGGSAPDAPGGLGQGADSLHQPPTTSPSTIGAGAPVTDSVGTGATTPGATTPGATTPGGTGWPETPSSGGGGGTPTGTGWLGDTPSDGAVDDLVRNGDASEGPDGPGPDGPTSPGTPGPSPTAFVDENGAVHEVRMAEELLVERLHFEESLARELADRGMSRGQFDALVAQPLEQLSATSVETLLQIREAMPPIQADDIVQKVIPPEAARSLLGGAVFDALVEPSVAHRLREAAQWTWDDGSPVLAQTPTLDGLQGFVARLADVQGMSSGQLFHTLGLGYQHSTFVADGSMFAVRDGAGDMPSRIAAGTAPWSDAVLEANQPLRTMRDAMYQPSTTGAFASRFDEIRALPDPAQRRDAWMDFAAERGADYTMGQALDPANPHRGNGFGGTGTAYAPEFTYGRNLEPLQPGAEMWQIRPDGTREIVAVWDGDLWLRAAGLAP